MLLANAIFLYLAVTTHSGGDTSNAYQKGLHYNATLEAAKLQSERGWRTELAYDDRTGRLILKVLDRAAAPITGLRVAASLERPATDRSDRKVALNELGEGVYATTIDLAPGAWVVAIASRRQGEDRNSAYRLTQRLVVAGTP
jgi:nitrogen fixation protein FixH